MPSASSPSPSALPPSLTAMFAPDPRPAVGAAVEARTPAAAPDTVPDDRLPALRGLLRQRLEVLQPAHGVLSPAGLPQLMLARNDGRDVNVCAVYEPCMALIVQGAKRVVFGSDSLVYDSARFLITSMDVPVQSTILDATRERPFLALILRLDLREVAELMLSGQVPPAPPAPPGRAMATGAVDAPLLEAALRLLALADAPQDIPVLAPLMLREILYRLLVGEAGERLRRIAAVDSQGRQIARAIDRLKACYAEPLRVEALAQEVRMSVSTFHHHFKALTAMSPLQFQKQLRLAEARRLMLAEHLDASTAAYRVGYESPSQFSREYSRHFGAPPMRDIAGLRARPPVEPVPVA